MVPGSAPCWVLSKSPKTQSIAGPVKGCERVEHLTISITYIMAHSWRINKNDFCLYRVNWVKKLNELIFCGAFIPVFLVNIM